MLKLSEMHNVTKERSLLSENCNLSSFMALLHFRHTACLISLSVVSENFFTASEKHAFSIALLSIYVKNWLLFCFSVKMHFKMYARVTSTIICSMSSRLGDIEHTSKSELKFSHRSYFAIFVKQKTLFTDGYFLQSLIFVTGIVRFIF